MKKIPSYKLLYGSADFIILTFSFLVSVYALRNDISISFFSFYSEIPQIIPLALILTFMVMLIFGYNGLYRLDIVMKRSRHIAHLSKAIYYSSLQIVLLSLIIDVSNLLDSRLLIFVFILISVSLLVAIRVMGLKWMFLTLSKSGFSRNVAIIGEGRNGKLLATKFLYENPFGMNIVGFIDDSRAAGDFVVAGRKILGNIGQLKEIIHQHSIDEIIVAIDDRSHEKILDILEECKKQKVTTRVTSEMFDVVSQRIGTEKYADIPVINISPQYNDRLTLGFKRLADIIFASLGLLFLSPFLIVIAVLIKITSPGPVLFKQERIGKDGKKFDFFKFRSMKVLNGEDEDRKQMMIEFMKNGGNFAGADKKIINDSRVTWIGNIIRRTSLDELPQLFNVIIGDMSLVGPRPCLPYEFENYDNWQKRRVSVIPGCTGVWQVWGRSTVTFEESVVLDLYYINNMSPWLDFQLILQTIPVMLFSRGAR